MKIRVSNIDRSTTEDELYDLFDEFGEVISCEKNEDPDPDRDTFTAWVEMQYVADAEEAIAELNGEDVDGRDLIVVEGHQEVQIRIGKTIEEYADMDEEELTDATGKDVLRRGLREGEGRAPARKPPRRGKR